MRRGGPVTTGEEPTLYVSNVPRSFSDSDLYAAFGEPCRAARRVASLGRGVRCCAVCYEQCGRPCHPHRLCRGGCRGRFAALALVRVRNVAVSVCGRPWMRVPLRRDPRLKDTHVSAFASVVWRVCACPQPT